MPPAQSPGIYCCYHQMHLVFCPRHPAYSHFNWVSLGPIFCTVERFSLPLLILYLFKSCFSLYIEAYLQREQGFCQSVTDTWIFNAVNSHANAGCHKNLTMDDGISGTPFPDLRSYCLSTNAAKRSSNITGPRAGLHFAQLMSWGKPWAKCLLRASKECMLASDITTVAIITTDI